MVVGMDSVYAGSPNVVFGRFPASEGNKRLGQACDQEVERCEDCDHRVVDIFGVPIRRGASAQHTSGRNMVGEDVCGGIVREIGINREVWAEYSGSTPSVIVSDWRRATLHVSEWSDAEYWFTIDGLRQQFDEREAFDATEVLRRVDAIRERNGVPKWRNLITCELHKKSVRRWLDSMVGVTNTKAGATPSKRYALVCGAPIVRHGRWSWFFKEPQ